MADEIQSLSQTIPPEAFSFRRRAVALITLHWVIAFGSFAFVSMCSASYRGWGLAIIPDLVGLAILDRRCGAMRHRPDDGRYVLWMVINLAAYASLTFYLAFQSF